METNNTYTAFSGTKLLLSGDIKSIVLESKKHLDSGDNAALLIFDDRTGKQVDFDLRGTPEDVLRKLPAHPLFTPKEEATTPRTGPGRPKLGIVCREISLLPRHWEWLEQQPQGASGTLRKLVEEAKRRDPDKEHARKARDAAGNFMWAMSGNLPGFEEASRALYAGDVNKLEELTKEWPKDVRDYAMRLLQGS